MLFLIIVFLVGYAYIMYQQVVLARLYFNQIEFNKKTRAFRIFDEHKELIEGRLGMSFFTWRFYWRDTLSLLIKSDDFSYVCVFIAGTNIRGGKPFTCLNEYAVHDGNFCFEWDHQARMYLSQDKNTKNCYHIKWQSLVEGGYPTDCFNFGDDSEYWYGAGITKDNDWPINKANFDFTPFITGDATMQRFGNALGRYFISSGGVAIEVDERTPLYISMNRNSSGQFCMRAMNDAFAFVNRLTPLPELKYKICYDSDIKELHKTMRQQYLWDGLKDSDLNTVHAMLEEPIWQISPARAEQLNESTIYNFTEDVIAMGYMRLGHVLINEFWQKEIGDFAVDTERFPTLGDTVNILHRRGFKVVFTVQPFISTDSHSFSEAVQKKLLIYERLSERSIPALTRYKSAPSTGVLDVTNNASVPWLVDKLNSVVKDYQIDSFFLDFGTAHNMPHYYQCSKSLINPDQYKTIFGANFEDAIKIMAFSGAISVPSLPAFLSLPPVNSSWEGLQTIITTALSYGIIGYPFILPGPIGGDYFVTTNDTKMLSYHSLELPPLPEQELFIRWLQLATFLPSIRFSHLPDEYNSDYVTEIAKELVAVRQKTVIPILKKYLNDAMNEGVPLVRPLWMLDPQDPACLAVNDEFSIGEELIVAPILRKGETKREVYLPYGVWKDGVDGSLRKGHRWIHNYRVPEDKVAYFVKMPDNTRFRR